MANPTESTSTDNSFFAVPVLPLRDVVVYPYMVIPLFVGREQSINALEAATDENKQILLVAQKDSSEEQPSMDNLFETGTLATILQLLKLPDGTVKVLVEGTTRAKITSLNDEDNYLKADIADYIVKQPKEPEAGVLMKTLLEQFEQYVKSNKKIPPEVMASLSSIDDADRMADTVAAHMSLKLDDKQLLLELTDINARIEKLLVFLESEIDVQHIEKRIRGRVKKQMDKSQREYYLNEQMKAFQKELGEIDEVSNETD